MMMENTIAISANRVTKKFSNGKIGLHESSFEIQSKTLVAILGPSGCGKSTLLKALNGDSRCTGGTIHINGLELNNTNFDYIKRHIGYVPQDDIVHNDLTVEQSLWYSSKLRLTESDNIYIENKIEEVLDIFNLKDIRKSKVGDVSGGQRKRLAIAIEILTDPLILFLDEPTSPLDPQTIGEFLKTLKTLANRGTTVVMVTHKPEDLDYMDKVIFMAEGGYMAYYGDKNSKEFLSYFKSYDILEVYSKLVKNNALEWIEKYKLNNPHPTSIQVGLKNQKQPQSINYITQYFWLTIRYFNIKLNDIKNLLIMLAQAPIIAGLICVIFPTISQIVLFFISISAIWFGTNNAAREIVVEKLIFKRERMINQAIFPYILSKLTVLGIIALVQSFIFIFIIWYNYKTKNIHLNNPVMTFWWMTSLSISSTLLGLLLSSLFNKAEKVMSFIPLALIPQIMLAGIIVKIDNVFKELLSYLTLSRWGSEGFAKIQENVSIPNHKIVFEGKPKIVESSIDTSAYAMDVITKNFDKSYTNNFSQFENSISIDLLAISFIGFIFFTSIFLALKDKDSFN
jgi:ABC-type multidrug transport system ATPase subunit